MDERASLLTLAGSVLAFALPFGVYLTAMGLEDGDAPSRLWVGLLLLALGIVGVECLRLAHLDLRAEADQARSRKTGLPLDTEAVRRLHGAIFNLYAATVVLLQVVAVMQFLLMLDGHVRLRACLWVYLAYLDGVILILATRADATRWGERYLLWGWAPILAFGIPLALPTLKAAGLARFAPLQW